MQPLPVWKHVGQAAVDGSSTWHAGGASRGGSTAEDRTQAFAALTEARSLGVEPRACDYAIEIGAGIRQRDWRRALSFGADLLERGLEPSLRSWNAEVHAWSASGRWLDASGALAEMRMRGLQADAVSYGTAVVARRGRLTEAAVAAVGSIIEMGWVGLELGVASYNVAISACGSALQWALVVQALNAMRRQSVESNVITGGAAVDSCGSSARWESSLLALSSMACHALIANVVCYGAALGTRAHGKRWAWVFCLLADMRWRGPKLNAVACNASIGTLVSGDLWAHAAQVLSDMEFWGPEPTVVSYGALSGACQNGVLWVDALYITGTLLARSLGLDLLTSLATIGACGKSGLWAAAFLLLGAQRSRVSEPSAIAYNAAAKACEQRLHWLQGVELVEDMQREGLEADAVTCSTIVSSCGCVDRWASALYMMRSARINALELDSVGSNTALTASERGSQWTTAVVFFDEASTQGLELDVVASGAVVRACERGDQWTGSLHLFDRLGERGLERNVIIGSAVIGACAHRWQWQGAMSLVLDAGGACSDDISARAALGALAASQRESQGIVLLKELRSRGAMASPLALAWALARLLVRDALLLREAMPRSVDAAALVRETSRPGDIVSLAWTYAALGLRAPGLFAAVAAETAVRLSKLPLRDLSLLVWAFATVSAGHVALLRAIADEFDSRLAGVRPRDAFSLLVALWALHLQGLLRKSSYSRARLALLRAGRARDHSFQVRGARGRAWKPCIGATCIGRGATPGVLLDLPDRMVIRKPPGWQMDADIGLKATILPTLLEYVRSLLPPRWHPVVSDYSSGRGLLHRLDAPCSGLILMATTYAAYYDLRSSLDVGALARDYVVLCRGLASSARSWVHARIDRVFADVSPGVVLPEGRLAGTCTKVLAQTEVTPCRDEVIYASRTEFEQTCARANRDRARQKETARAGCTIRCPTADTIRQ